MLPVFRLWLFKTWPSLGQVVIMTFNRACFLKLILCRRLCAKYHRRRTLTSWMEMLRVTSAFTPQRTPKSSATLEQSYRRSTAGSLRFSQVWILVYFKAEVPELCLCAALKLSSWGEDVDDWGGTFIIDGTGNNLSVQEPLVCMIFRRFHRYNVATVKA